MWLGLPHNMVCYDLALEVGLVVFTVFCALKGPQRHTQVQRREDEQSRRQRGKVPEGHTPSAIRGHSKEVDKEVSPGPRVWG